MHKVNDFKYLGSTDQINDQKSVKTLRTMS